MNGTSRADVIFAADLAHLHERTSRIFAWLMLVQWVGAVVASLCITPYTWIGRHFQLHQHVWIAIFGGALLSAVPIALALRRPTAVLTRHVIALAQVLYSALLIHLTGGRIETHFHIFGSLAFLALYRDWKVLITASIVVALDHALRGEFAPQSVFGTTLASRWRWLEHAGWVVFEDIVIISSCVQGLREMRRLAHKRADLESSHHAVEGEVQRRTEELTRTAAALRQSESETRAANHAKSEFLANMSHEIRTPMTAIIGYADLLLDPDQPVQERLDFAQIIRRNGEHLLSVINDILDVSKVEAGQMRVESIRCCPVQIVTEVYSLMRHRAAQKNIALRVERNADLPPISSDPLRLKQILVNLIGNAIKFTPRGEVRVRIIPEVLGAACRLRFDVIDTGIGMTAEQINRVFSPFSQADSSTSRRFGGSGLGLTISRNLARLLGGDVTCSSVPGQGSTFTFELTAPLAAAAQPVLPAQPIADSTARLHCRILLAEDGPDNQRLFSFHLRRAGADVVIVADGQQAITAALESGPFDLILMDMQMPEVDGYNATAELRARGLKTPIIALTAHAMSSDRDKCLAFGCDEYLAKPIDRDRLIATCARFTSKAQNAAA